jgi:hypothetical protein
VKDVVGLVAMLMVFVLLYVASVFQLPPSVAEVKAARAAVCEGRGRPVTVNGELVACSLDAQTWQVWTPEGDWRDVDLVRMNWEWDDDGSTAETD